MKFPLVLALFGAVFASVAVADVEREIADCASKAADASRLVCYDELARSLGVDQPVTQTGTGSGNWVVRTETSPIDDSINVHLSVMAEERVTSRYKDVRPSLHLRCAENTTSVFLNWNLYLGLDTTRMLTRFDREPASTDTWLISTNNKAVFVRGSDIGFAKKMMSHDKLLAQITPHSANAVMATFPVTGLSEAIKPLREACNW